MIKRPAGGRVFVGLHLVQLLLQREHAAHLADFEAARLIGGVELRKLCVDLRLDLGAAVARDADLGGGYGLDHPEDPAAVHFNDLCLRDV